MKAWQLLDSKEKWCKGSAALNKEGKSVVATNYDACKWCLYGAIEKCYGSEYFLKMIEPIEERQPAASLWNDDPHRTWEEVHALLKELDL